jgi:Zn-dependent peptidase ImmA (M78 family)
MPSFNPERLKTARLLAGFSLRQLEEAVARTVSYAAINKYEKGLMQPDAGTIIRFADVLKVRAAYFFEQSTVQLGEINFRKKRNLSDSATEQIKEMTRDKVERTMEAEKLLNLSNTFQNPLGKKQVKDPAKAEEMAHLVREEWGLGIHPIANVIEMLEENDVKVIEIKADDAFDGLSTYVNDEIPVAVVNDSFTIERKRFTALHELGHLMMNIKIASEAQKENACHRFAGAMLFPSAAARKQLGEKRSQIAMGELVAIKEEYGISVQATMRRALDLDIISQGAYKQFFMTLRGNNRETGLGSYKGEEKSYRLHQLVFRLLSERVISMEKAASIAGMSVAAFSALYNNVPLEEDEYLYRPSPTAFAAAWSDDEPEYSLADIKTINPDYAGR